MQGYIGDICTIDIDGTKSLVTGVGGGGGEEHELLLQWHWHRGGGERVLAGGLAEEGHQGKMGLPIIMRRSLTLVVRCAG